MELFAFIYDISKYLLVYITNYITAGLSKETEKIESRFE